jgi:hypothetical protein
MSWVAQAPVTGDADNDDVLTLTNTNRYVKTKITAVPAKGLQVVLPTLTAEKPEVTWQISIDIADPLVTTFAFKVGTADVAITKDVPAGWGAMVFDFYWDGEQLRAIQRTTSEHMFVYQEPQ